MNTKKNPKIITITGPTGSGKTSLALTLAKRYPVEIISVDSRQIYRFMNIGTAKPTNKELKQVTHHLIDIRNPDEKYDAGQFVDEVKKIVPDILNRNHIPILTGGSGMYIWALENGLFNAERIPEKTITLIQKIGKDQGLAYLYELLKKVDPESAARIHPNDKQRITRALEVFEFTKKPMSLWQKENTEKSFPFQLVKFIISPDRHVLYHKINARVDYMIQNGLIEEVENLLKRGYSLQNNSMRSVGYQEVINYLINNTDRQLMIESIKKNTRNYAKRQLTWFRKHSGIWLNYSENEELKTLYRSIQSEIIKYY